MMKSFFPFLFLFGIYSSQTFNQPNDIYYCDINNDGVEVIDLTQIQSQVTTDTSIVFKYYDFNTDVEIVNPSNYIATGNADFYILQQSSGPGNPFEAEFHVIKILCSGNEDNDGVPNNMEDLNHDNNFNNDDTDHDNIANFKDADDDGDGILTINEDYNRNGNPADDDINSNGIPDYLDAQITLNNSDVFSNENLNIFPNPTKDFITISLKENIIKAELYTASGDYINTFETNKINVSSLANGIYILKIYTSKSISIRKVIKN